MISVKQATGFINTLGRHFAALEDAFSQGDSLDEKARKVSDYVSKNNNDSANADQLRKLPECAWANLLICHEATNNGAELAILANGLNKFLETKPDINDISNVSIAELKKYLLEEAEANRLGNISAARLNQIGNEAIVNLLSFAKSFQQEAVHCDQEGNVTIYRNVELKTDRNEISAFILRNADQERLIVSHEELNNFINQWRDKGIMFGLNSISGTICIASLRPTNDPFTIDINVTNSETKQPAIFRIMVNKITGDPQPLRGTASLGDQTSVDKWYKDIPLLGFLGGLVFTGLTAIWAGKSENKGLPVGLSVLGAVATTGSAILTWLPEVFVNIGFDRCVKKVFKQL